MFRKGKSARFANKIGAFVLIIAAGTLHRIKKITNGVYNLKNMEKILKQGDLIPESIQRLFRDDEKPKETLQKTDIKENADFFQSSALRKIRQMDLYNEKLRVYESYRKYSVFRRLFQKK